MRWRISYSPAAAECSPLGMRLTVCPTLNLCITMLSILISRCYISLARAAETPACPGDHARSRSAPADLFRLEQQPFRLGPPAKGLCCFAGLLFGRCGIETAQDQIPRRRPVASVVPQETSRIIAGSNQDDRRSGKLQGRF